MSSDVTVGWKSQRQIASHRMEAALQAPWRNLPINQPTAQRLRFLTFRIHTKHRKASEGVEVVI